MSGQISHAAGEDGFPINLIDVLAELGLQITGFHQTVEDGEFGQVAEGLINRLDDDGFFVLRVSHRADGEAERYEIVYFLFHRCGTF